VAGRLEAGGRWVPSADIMFLGNESAEAWSHLLDTVAETDVLFDQFDSSVLADGDKGMISAVGKFQEVDYFICSYHRGKNLVMQPGCNAAT
jgi:hypothetical protein